MKFIHLSDLHLGKRVNDFSMIEDQKYILAQILNIIDEENVEAVIIAGDIYDKPVPSEDAVKLYDYFLTKLAAKKRKVFTVSGNHDSAERVAFGANLLNNLQIFVSPAYDGKITYVKEKDEYGEINIYLMPFIKPAYVRRFYPEETITTYNEAVKTVISHMNINESVRNILVAHQFVTGASRCESEDISVGGIDNVDANAFEAFDYVALGHLHTPQTVGRDTVYYSGTPLQYSFSETKEKYAAIIDINEKGNINIHKVQLNPKRKLMEIKGTYDGIMAKDYYKNFNLEDYYHITLTDEEDIPDAISKVRSVYENIMKLDYDNKRTRNNQVISGSEEIEKKSPLQLIEEFYKLQNNIPMSQEQLDFTRELLENLEGGK